MALPAVKEYYGFVSCGVARAKLGAFAWLSLACFALETLVRVLEAPRCTRMKCEPELPCSSPAQVVLKLGRGMFEAPWPRRVRASWAVSLALLSGVWLAWAARSARRARLAQTANKKQ